MKKFYVHLEEKTLVCHHENFKTIGSLLEFVGEKWNVSSHEICVKNARLRRTSSIDVIQAKEDVFIQRKDAQRALERFVKFFFFVVLLI